MVMDIFMQAAIEEAKKGLAEGGIPIGSVLVRNGKIIGRGHNMRVQENDPLAHAEIVCIRNAGRIGNYSDTTLYSTLMPCYLCAGAAVQFGIKKVIVGESVNFSGGPEFMREHGIEVTDMSITECKEMMSKFIRDRPDLWYEDIGK
jgi:cytosine deaminase